jgi:hypothetical protein
VQHHLKILKELLNLKIKKTQNAGQIKSKVWQTTGKKNLLEHLPRFGRIYWERKTIGKAAQKIIIYSFIL